MTILLRQLLKLYPSSSLKRSFHSSCMNALYEGDGKTTVTILNKNFDYGLMVDHLSEYGFQLNNGIRIVGPMIIFPKTMLSWNVASSADMNKESFSLLLNIEPKLDIVVIGLDDEYPYNAPFILRIKDIFKQCKIPLEILPVYRACSVFNYLNSESRYAAGALIPPKSKFIEDFILLEKDKSDQLKEGKKVKKIARYQSDEVLPTPDFDSLNAESLAKNKEIKEYFKVRRPWKEGNETNSSHPVDKDKKKS